MASREAVSNSWTKDTAPKGINTGSCIYTLRFIFSSRVQTHHTIILLNILFAGIRQDDREGGGGGIAEHQRTIQGCSVMPKMPNGHRQNSRVQQDDMRKLRPVLLLHLRQGHQWLWALQVGLSVIQHPYFFFLNTRGFLYYLCSYVYASTIFT